MRYVLGSLVAMVILACLLALNSRAASGLLVYCAAGLQPPVEESARAFEAVSGVPVRLQYGGSQTLLANAEISRLGDLYIPADDDYLHLAREKGLIAETVTLARMRPVVAVRRGNPLKIERLSDLLRSDVRVALARPETAAIGRLARDRLRELGQWELLRSKAVVMRPTVGDVANDVKVGAADAAFVWDANVVQMPDLEAVTLPEFSGATARVSAAVLRSSTRVEQARALARFLAAAEGGRPIFARLGYGPPDGGGP